MEHNTRKERIQAALQAALAPVVLNVIDESAQHAHHQPHFGGAGFEGETHFRIKVSSPAFAGQSRLARHRMVNEILASELATGLHALALETQAPGE